MKLRHAITIVNLIAMPALASGPSAEQIDALRGLGETRVSIAADAHPVRLSITIADHLVIAGIRHWGATHGYLMTDTTPVSSSPDEQALLLILDDALKSHAREAIRYEFSIGRISGAERDEKLRHVDSAPTWTPSFEARPE